MTPDELIEAAARRARNMQRERGGRKPYTDAEWQEFLHAARTSPGSGAAQHMRETRAVVSLTMEACAKEADALHSTTRADGKGAAYHGNVSDRIRALAPKVEG